MAKKTKHSVLRVRKESKTDRDRLGTMTIPNKKKEANKRKSREKNYDW